MNNKKIIAIIGAMDCEIDSIKLVLKNINEYKISSFTVYIGQLADKTILISKCGVGKVNAALHTQFIIDTYKPDLIINSGIAGAINPDLNILDIVVAEKLVQHDFDATVLGYSKGYMCTGKQPEQPTWYYSEKKALTKFCNLYRNENHNTKVVSGIIATGDMFVSSNEYKSELRKVFKADAVEMEAAAIAQVANFNSVPCLIVRTIADLADNSASEANKTTEKEMAEYSASKLIPFLSEI